MSIIDESLRNVAVREELARRVAALLRADSRVVAAELCGSLTGKSDSYSDIDIQIRLYSGVSDRRFAEDVPHLLNSIGPRLTDAWGMRTLPSKYARTLFFADYPLFWHIDVGCIGGEHEDESDLLTAYHWPRYFKTWTETLKRFLRGKVESQPDYAETALRRWLVLLPDNPALSPAKRLASYLDLCAEQTRAESLSRKTSTPPRPRLPPKKWKRFICAVTNCAASIWNASKRRDGLARAAYTMDKGSRQSGGAG